MTATMRAPDRRRRARKAAKEALAEIGKARARFVRAVFTVPRISGKVTAEFIHINDADAIGGTI